MNPYGVTSQFRDLVQREALSGTEVHYLWRLESGALRIDSADPDGVETLVRLALPGDLLGMESALGVPDRFSVRALTASRLVPINRSTGELSTLLMACVITGYQRNRDMVRLRSGCAADRIKALLRMLTQANSTGTMQTAACTLPTLSDIAAIVHAAPETVSRALAGLRQTSFLHESSPQGDKHKRLALRAHCLQRRDVGAIATGVAAC